MHKNPQSISFHHRNIFLRSKTDRDHSTGLNRVFGGRNRYSSAWLPRGNESNPKTKGGNSSWLRSDGISKVSVIPRAQSGSSRVKRGAAITARAKSLRIGQTNNYAGCSRQVERNPRSMNQSQPRSSETLDWIDSPV